MTITKDKFSITELSSLLNVTDHTLRYYEKEFSLPIPRDSRGRRYYDSSLYDIFVKIKNLRDEGMDIKSIKEFLSNNINTNTLLSTEDSKENSISISQYSSNSKSISTISMSIDNIEKSIDEIKELLLDLTHSLPTDITSEISFSTAQIINTLNNSSTRLNESISTNNRIIESKLERHFSKIDDSLSEWRKKSKGGVFKQLFQKIGLMPY